jgi:acetyl/propionyl-CoA carboxylase alpha subunit
MVRTPTGEKLAERRSDIVRRGAPSIGVPTPRDPRHFTNFLPSPGTITTLRRSLAAVVRGRYWLS